MTVSREKIHTYLGMKLDYRTPKQVKITIIEFLEKILETCIKTEPDGGGTKNSAAPEDLFKIDNDNKKLGIKKIITFHNIFAKILFWTKQAKPDTGTSISFLTSRVKEPDINDWRKLGHLMKYIRKIINLLLILVINNNNILK